MLKVFKTFYAFLWQYKKSFLGFAFTLVLGGILGNLNPYFYKLLVDNIPSKDYNLLLRLVIFLIAARIVANLINSLSMYLGDKALIPASCDARIKVFKHIQDLDFAFHTNKSTGALISVFKRGDSAFFGLFHHLNIHIFQTILSFAIGLFFFNLITPSIVWIMALVFAANIFIGWHLIKNNIKKRRAFNLQEDMISGVIADNMINYETVKFFAQEKKEEKRLRHKFTGWIEKLWSYANSFRLMDIIIGTFSNLGIFAIFWMLIKKMSLGEITTGDMVMVLSFTTGFYYRFFDLLYTSREIAKDYVDISRYLAVLDEKILIKDPEKPVSSKNIKGEIDFEDVVFDYPNGEKGVLNNFNLHIKAKESVAFVGRSGVGKTTIVRLLLRFYDVTKGQILIDGTNIQDFSKSQLRSFIGVVPQEPILFNNTVGFNLAYGKNKISRQEIIKATKMANLYSFIRGLSEEFDTQVGERGIKLSGGQKQRLAIARMILADPKIIIFDEATSNLDSESEELIQDSLWKIAQDRTVLIIAHRFSTVRKTDKIVVLEKGKIAEMGSHQRLLRKKGLYSYLWNLQNKGGKGSL